MHNSHDLLHAATIDQLTAFIAVAESGSFVGAARSLERDASVISRRIHDLEARLGVRLFARTTRRVVVTEIGARYQERIALALEELSAATREASELADEPRGILRVSVPVAFGRLWVAPLLSRFLKAYPLIKIDVRFADRVVDLVSEGFDVAVRTGVMSDSSLRSRRIASYRYLLAAAPAYLAIHGRPRKPDDLADHSCLGFSGLASWPNWPLSKEGKSKTIRPAGPLVADSSEVVYQSAIAGAGIILAPDWLVAPALTSGQLIEILSGWGTRGNPGVYAVTPPGRYLPQKTRLFIDALVQEIEGGWGLGQRSR